MRFLIFSLLATLISCSMGSARKDIESGVYRSSGSEQFFLTELPNWANFSAPGKCFKQNSVQYLDFSKLIETYQLSYVEMIELQAQYNERLESYYRSTTVKFLKPIEQASFFSNALEQVRGGVRTFKLPQVKEVEVIWLEGSTPQDIKKLARSGRFDQRLPVLFSSCRSRQGLVQWVTENDLDEVGFYILSAEWLAPFTPAGTAMPGPYLSLGDFLGKDKKITFFSSLNKQTPELVYP